MSTPTRRFVRPPSLTEYERMSRDLRVLAAEAAFTHTEHHRANRDRIGTAQRTTTVEAAERILDALPPDPPHVVARRVAQLDAASAAWVDWRTRKQRARRAGVAA